jgi:hypothetical protein
MGETDPLQTEQQLTEPHEKQTPPLTHKIKSILRRLPGFNALHAFSERKDVERIYEVRTELDDSNVGSLVSRLKQSIDESRPSKEPEELQKKMFKTKGGEPIAGYVTNFKNGNPFAVTPLIEGSLSDLIGVAFPDNSIILSNDPTAFHQTISEVKKVDRAKCVNFICARRTPSRPMGSLQIYALNDNERMIRDAVGFLCQAWPIKKQEALLRVGFLNSDPTKNGAESKQFPENTIAEYLENNKVR